jgi:hypothetical protein
LKSHNKRWKDGGNPRYRLNQDEAEIINNYRRAIQECEKEGLDPKTLHSGWIKNDNASLYFKQPKATEKDFKKLAKEVIEEAKQYSPKYPKLNYKKYTDGHLLFMCPSDLHIGKLCRSFVSGEEYNNQIAVTRALEGVRGCLAKSQGFNIDKTILLLSGDLLHVDNFNMTTTSGTRQDSDGLLSDHFLIAKRLMVEIIEMLLQVSTVHVMFTPGNHDNTVGWMVAELLAAWFRHNKDVTFDVSLQMRKYYKYKKNLISSCHGHKIKADTLPMIVADECADWSSTKYRYMFTQHIHHKVSKQYPGLWVESLMSPSEADTWHHTSGYQSSNNKAIESFLFSEFGQIARITHLF